MNESKRIEAVCVIKTDELLCQSYALTIENNKLVSMRQLTRAEDLPSVAIGLAQRDLWSQYRVNKEKPDVKTKA